MTPVVKVACCYAQKCAIPAYRGFEDKVSGETLVHILSKSYKYTCGDLNVNCPPQAHVSEHSVPSCQSSLGHIHDHLGGGVLLEEVGHCGWALSFVAWPHFLFIFRFRPWVQRDQLPPFLQPCFLTSMDCIHYLEMYVRTTLSLNGFSSGIMPPQREK